MATYIMDALRYKEGAFMAAWLTMGAANCAAVFSALLLRSEGGIALTLLAFALNALTLFLTGACARAPPTAGWPAPAAVGAAGVLHPACMSSGGCASPRPHPPPTPPLPPPPSLQACGSRCSSASCSCSTPRWWSPLSACWWPGACRWRPRCRPGAWCRAWA